MGPWFGDGIMQTAYAYASCVRQMLELLHELGVGSFLPGKLQNLWCQMDQLQLWF
jgi:hypothetical protein